MGYYEGVERIAAELPASWLYASHASRASITQSVWQAFTLEQRYTLFWKWWCDYYGDDDDLDYYDIWGAW